MELLEITDREFDTYKKNLARNYRRYEKAFENRSRKIYSGEKLTKKQFFGKYLEAKQRGLKYSIGLLVKPFLGDNELEKINAYLFTGMEFSEFKKMFYSLPIEEQKGLIHYYFKSGLANYDADFQYEGVTFDSADPDVQSILDIIAKNRIRRGME